jgi:sugar transferase (PEP-CTERM/EpsH1 system associated)
MTARNAMEAGVPAPDPRPLIAHVMHRFDTGGLENGVVNLINHMPDDRFRHAVVALTEVTDFRDRVKRRDVEFVALNKPPGQGVWQFPKWYRLLRRMRPEIVHTRNLAALECQIPAWGARVPIRIHGEHGRDVGDLDGSNRTYQRVRRFYRPFVHHYLALSRDLAHYLSSEIQVPQSRITQVYNGVDTTRFQPAPRGPVPIQGCPFHPARHWIVGTVGRMQAVKDQVMLARAFVHAVEQEPAIKDRLRLVMIGDGPLRAQAQAILQDVGVAELAWLPGERSDVADIMRGLHAFALPSLAEGISNTVLEAMASALPVIATDVGGNADLVMQGETGDIIAAADPLAMARRILHLVHEPDQARLKGIAGRQRVESQFSMAAMVRNYQRVYDDQLWRIRAVNG